MGCLDSIMKLFRSGDHIVCGENVYGGTFRLFDKLLQHLGLSFTYVDTRTRSASRTRARRVRGPYSSKRRRIR